MLTGAFIEVKGEYAQLNGYTFQYDLATNTLTIQDKEMKITAKAEKIF